MGNALLRLPKIVSDFVEDFSRVCIVNILYLGYGSSDEHARRLELLVGGAGDCCGSCCLQYEQCTDYGDQQFAPGCQL
ncbi:MAG: hypothetical protein WC647_16385 [Desulfomonilaceae bacterium]|jgi:hypothetical protein